MATTIYPLRERPRVASAGAANEDVFSAKVEPGWTHVITSYGVEDEDTALTAIRVAIDSGGYPYWFEHQLNPVAATFYDGFKVQILSEGERIQARFIGSTSGDDLILILLGMKFPPGVELPPELMAMLLARRPHA